VVKEKKMATEQEWSELKIASRLENLEKISDFIATTMRNLGMKEEKDIFDVQLAVDEACTNIIEHAYEGKKDGVIWIKCKMDKSKKEFVVKIIDKGKPFDPEAVLTPNTKAALDERKAGGLGIFFMKVKMQNIKYTFSNLGNELTMTKVLD
jgi:serine/threonine-protein kinase RsbW